MTKSQLKKVIKETITESIKSYKRTAKSSDKTFQPLSILMEKERKIRSLVGGLETSLGINLWKKLALKIAPLNNYQIVKAKFRKPLNIPEALVAQIRTIQIARKDDNNKLFNAITTRDTIKNYSVTYSTFPIPVDKTESGSGVPLWFKKDNINYIFDTRTVQPNVKKFKTLFDQLLDRYAHFYYQFPKENLYYRIVFPYNPYYGEFWANSKGKGFPITPKEEALVQDEFWDLISGYPKTFDLILECFKELRNNKIVKAHLKLLFGF